MKKLYPLLSVLFLIYWGCEEEQPEEVDTTPTEVTLWGVTYSVEDTDSLDLTFNDLTGSIPPEIELLINLTYLNLGYNQLIGPIPSEIGNLTNLTYLTLYNNQLTETIPESICDLNINWSNAHDLNISDNKLCPPYPSCIEDYVGEQDTSNCD